MTSIDQKTEKHIAHLARRKSYREANREKIRMKSREWYAANRHRVAILSAIAISRLDPEKREKRRIARKKYQEKNADKNRARVKAWIAANPEKKRLNDAKHNALHPENLRARKRNYRARKRKAGGTHTRHEIKCLLEKQKYRCANSSCRASIKTRYRADHIQPISRGGSNWIKNIQLLCASCNWKKTNKDPIVWAQENGMLL